MFPSEQQPKYGVGVTARTLELGTKTTIYPNPKGKRDGQPTIITGTVIQVRRTGQIGNPAVIFHPDGGLREMSLGGGTAAFPLHEEPVSLSPITTIPRASQEKPPSRLRRLWPF